MAKVVERLADPVPEDARVIFRPTAENLVTLDEQIHDRRGYWGVPDATNGTFRTRTVRDAKLGDVFETEHVKDDARIPAVVWEGRNYGLTKPVKLRLSELRGFGLWIRGNGSYGKVKLLLSKDGSPYPYEVECGERGYVTFGGWQYVDMDLSEWTPACGWLKGADEVTLWYSAATSFKDWQDASSVDEKAKAEEKAATEREKEIQREHEQRMRLIQEETKARLDQEQKIQQQASSRFEKEFAMWLDPEARDRRFDEEEKRRQDIERMKTDVLRTGSSGRVREIAELMRAGDEEGVEQRFATWRRGGWFGGMGREQEQLIRTAAAYETQDDAKRNIARIAENTEALSDKLDSLLKVK